MQWSDLRILSITSSYLYIALFKITIWCSGVLFKGSETHHLGLLKWRRRSVSALGAKAAEHLKSGSHPHSAKFATMELAMQALNESTKNMTPVHSLIPFLSASFSLITSELHQYEK